MTPPGPDDHRVPLACAARVIWTENTVTGRKMPVDAAPDSERGNVLLTSGNAAPLATVLTNAELAARPSRRGLHVSHFATCPQGPAWRKNR